MQILEQLNRTIEENISTSISFSSIKSS